jgi:dephospho-CoA kinase
MQIVGIVGGVASGKTLVARQFEKLGAGVLEADAAGREVLRMPEVETAIERHFGRWVFDAEGHVDRARLAEIVFAPSPAGARERKYLEQLTHPRIGDLLRARAEVLAGEGCQVAVLDAPLLFEVGWDELCDKVVFVDSPRPLRQERARSRGWSKEDFAAREGVQKSLDQKRAGADVIIDNAGSPESTQAQVERFWHSLVG